MVYNYIYRLCDVHTFMHGNNFKKQFKSWFSLNGHNYNIFKKNKNSVFIVPRLM